MLKQFDANIKVILLVTFNLNRSTDVSSSYSVFQELYREAFCIRAVLDTFIPFSFHFKRINTRTDDFGLLECFYFLLILYVSSSDFFLFKNLYREPLVIRTVLDTFIPFPFYFKCLNTRTDDVGVFECFYFLLILYVSSSDFFLQKIVSRTF